MADLPNTPITPIPAETPGGAEWPTFVQITVADLVGPVAANRQPNQTKTRTETNRDRINQIIADLDFIELGGPGGANAFLPRDGGQAMDGDLDFGTNKGVNVVNPTAAQDAATKAYVDGLASVGAEGYYGEIKLIIGIAVSTQVEVEFVRVIDTTGVKLLAPTSNKVVNGLSSGANGLDTGVLATNTWYYIWVIGDSSGANPTEGILSLSPGAPFGAGAAGTPSGISPVLPGGYDLFRRIGSCRTEGTPLFRPARKIDGDTYYETRHNLGAGVPGGGWAGIACAAFIPPIAERGMFNLQGGTALGNGGGYAIEFSDGGGSTFIVAETFRFGDAVILTNKTEFRLHVSATQMIFQRHLIFGGAGSNGNHAVFVRGYVDDMKHST